jgi:DNA topoisomerase-3
VKENYRRYACTGKPGRAAARAAASRSARRRPGAPSRWPRPSSSCATRRSARWTASAPRPAGRSRPRWCSSTTTKTKNWKLEFDFGDDKKGRGDRRAGGLQRPANRWAPAPSAAPAVHEHGKNYVCEKSVPTAAQPTPSCDFKSGKVILQQPVEREQMRKLLATGKTDLLDKFVSMRTRRAFKAFLAWDAEGRQGELRVRAVQVPAAQDSAAKTGATNDRGTLGKAAKTLKSAAAREEGGEKGQPPRRPPKKPRARHRCKHRRRPQAQRSPGRGDRRLRRWPAPR